MAIFASTGASIRNGSTTPVSLTGPSGMANGAAAWDLISPEGESFGDIIDSLILEVES